MKHEITIVGAGIIGICSALWLQQADFKVTLIDRDQPGHGASFGNACSFMGHHFIPLSTPGVWKKIPAFLFYKESVFKLQTAYLPNILPWSLRFLWSSRRHVFEDSVAKLADLCCRLWEGYDPLIKLCDAESLIRRTGFIHLSADETTFKHRCAFAQLRQQYGVEIEVWNAERINHEEPNLNPIYYGAHYYLNSGHTVDPLQLMMKFFDTFLAQGGTFIQQEVDHIKASTKQLILSDGQIHHFDQLLIAAGAWSKKLCKQLGDVPSLEAERGYHVMYQLEQPLISRPILIYPGYCAFAPMSQNRLRVTSISELAGLDSPPNQRCIEHITQYANRLLSGLPPVQSTWLGFRPSTPDAIPVMRQANEYTDIYYAFGHGHLGLTLGGISGKILAQMISP